MSAKRFILLPGFVFVCIAFTASFTLAQESKDDAAAKITFDDHIQPLFRQRCSSCHNPDRRNGDLDVTSYANLMQGGASGTVIEPGDVDFSYLYSLVNHDEEPKMPPSGEKLPAKEMELIAAWINGGALENMGSKAVVKKKTEMAIVENPTAKPAVVPMPARTVLEPVIQPARASNADAIATSPWAPIVALGGQKQVLLYNTQTAKLAGVIPFDDGQVNSIRFSRNGDLLAIGGGKAGLSGKVVIWNLVKGEWVTTIGDELDAVLACDISPDQSMVALGGPLKTVKVFSTETGEQLYEMTKHTDWITAIEFSPDGALLVTGDRNGGLHTWEAMTGREYMTLKGHTKAITSVSWRSDSNLVASASEDATVRLWELNGGRQIKSWGAHGGGTLSLEFTRDGRIATSGRDKLVKLWDQQGAAIKTFSAMDDIVSDVSFCDESSCVIGGAFGGHVAMWHTESESIARRLEMAPPALQNQTAAAKTLLEQHTSKLNEVTQKFQAANLAFTNQTSKLNELLGKRKTTDTAIQQLVVKVTNSNSEATAAEQQQVALAVPLTQTNSALPLVEESLAKLNEAVGKSPSDAALQQAAKNLTDQITSMKARVAELQTQSQLAAAKKAKAAQLVVETNSEITANKSEMSELDKQVAELETNLPGLKTAVDAAQGELTSVQAKQTSSQENVTFWDREFAFKQQLEQLEVQLAAVKDGETLKAENLKVAQQKLIDAQAAFDAAKTQLEESQQQEKSVLEQIEASKRPLPGQEPASSEQ